MCHPGICESCYLFRPLWAASTSFADLTKLNLPHTEITNTAPLEAGKIVGPIKLQEEANEWSCSRTIDTKYRYDIA